MQDHLQLIIYRAPGPTIHVHAMDKDDIVDRGRGCIGERHCGGDRNTEQRRNSSIPVHFKSPVEIGFEYNLVRRIIIC
jgi:hypothetical protein